MWSHTDVFHNVLGYPLLPSGASAGLPCLLKVFRAMIEHKILPSIGTFGSLLSAASHSGSLDLVKEVTPTSPHPSCPFLRFVPLIALSPMPGSSVGETDMGKVFWTT